jgi:ribosome assembly protein 1
MMMGRELIMVDEVPAGNVCAIAGLEGKILRNGTLCGFGQSREIEDLDATKEKESLVNLAGLHSTVCISLYWTGPLADIDD